MSKPKIDLTNKQFGKLTVLHKTTNPKSKSKRTFWLCQCNCGNESIVDTTSLTSGKLHNVGIVHIRILESINGEIL